MSQIYKPKGRAREYSPFALNLYNGCSHDCEYCWARSLGKRRDKYYVHSDVHLQNVTRASIRMDCMKHARLAEQVLMCFTCDPYVHGFDTSMTTYALEQMLEFQIPVSILTKAPSNAIRDYSLMSQFGDSIVMGTTITTMHGYHTAEPHADSPRIRINALDQAKQFGIPTWLSMEPAYTIDEGLEIIEETSAVVDRYRVGKMNYRKLDTDWTDYVIQIVNRLRNIGKPIYVKNDLAEHAPTGFLQLIECDPRHLDARPFNVTIR